MGEMIKSESSIALAWKRRLAARPTGQQYRSPQIATLPVPSQILLSQSLMETVQSRVRNAENRKKITTTVEGIQNLLKKYPDEMSGVFAKAIIKLRSAVRNLPQEDVDPDYYAILEDHIMEDHDALREKLVEGLEWERKRTVRIRKPIQGTADVKVIAEPKLNLLSILINDHKNNVEFLFWGCIRMRKQLQEAIEKLPNVNLPESMKASIRKSLEGVIHSFSLEASIPYKLKNDFEEFLQRLEEPHPLSPEFASLVKLVEAKAENCLKDSERERDKRIEALKHIKTSFESIDKVLAETRRPYWMMDIPDTFSNRKRSTGTELFGYTEALKKKYNIAAHEEGMGCVCFRQRKDKKSFREVPLCPELLTYTEDLRKRWNIPPFRRDGKCYCDWLFQANVCSGGQALVGLKYDKTYRLYSRRIKEIAQSRDIVKDVTSCHCNWMKLQRVFGDTRKDNCLSQEHLTVHQTNKSVIEPTYPVGGT